MMESKQAMDVTDLDERMQQAVHELQNVIIARYPATTFELAYSPEDPRSIHLLVTADVDDPDEVGDLVVDRVVILQVEEDIPLHVIPLRTPERVQVAAVTSATPRSTRSTRLHREPA